MRHACLLALLAALAVALVPQAGARQQRGARDLAAERAAMVNLIDLIATHRDETWRWERVMHRPPTPSGNLALQMRSIAHSRRVLQLWQRRAAVAKREALNPPHKRQWLCIHRYEGSWRDPNAPYYGGLQMDLEFQTHLRPQSAPPKGNGRALDAAGADVGGRTCLSDTRVLAMAEHGAGIAACCSG